MRWGDGVGSAVTERSNNQELCGGKEDSSVQDLVIKKFLSTPMAYAKPWRSCASVGPNIGDVAQIRSAAALL